MRHRWWDVCVCEKVLGSILTNKKICINRYCSRSSCTTYCVACIQTKDGMDENALS